MTYSSAGPSVVRHLPVADVSDHILTDRQQLDAVDSGDHEVLVVEAPVQHPHLQQCHDVPQVGREILTYIFRVTLVSTNDFLLGLF